MAKDTVSMKEAARQLLEERGGPMKVADITEAALKRKLIATDGKTPAATMAAQLGTDANKAKEPTFVRTAPGTFGLKGRDRKGQKARDPEPIAA